MKTIEEVDREAREIAKTDPRAAAMHKVKESYGNGRRIFTTWFEKGKLGQGTFLFRIWTLTELETRRYNVCTDSEGLHIHIMDEISHKMGKIKVVNDMDLAYHICVE